jgi:Putative Ig domain/Multicopper oxidase
MRTLQHLVGACSLAVAGLALGVSPAWSAEFWLQARPLVAAEYPAGVPPTVPMWGYASCVGGFATCATAAASVPGPQLVVPPGDTTGLTIHLRNSLPPGLTVPTMTSIVIPGQREIAANGANLMVPVMFPGQPSPHGPGVTRTRIRSFTHETAPGQDVDYVWSNLEPGTYLYHSGTHSQVQVQMGLYGSVRRDAAAGQAYPGEPYASQVTLLFSEIDPALHVAVMGGGTVPDTAPPLVVPAYGTPPMTSTIDYQPKYFLINGAPYSAAALPIPAGRMGQRVLLRLLNAGLESHVATLLGGRFQVIAEDGNEFVYKRDQYETLLPAGKTMDVIWVPATGADYSFYDRRNRAGMLVKLTADGAPIIRSTPLLTATVNVLYTYDMNATDLDLPIVYALRGANPAGLTIDPGTGLVSWTPTEAQVGPQRVQLQATDATGAITQHDFTVLVNGPPIITSTPPLTALVGVPYVYTIVAEDPDLPIEYDPHGQPGTGFPQGMSVGISSGVVTWTPTLAQVGPQLVQLQATDGVGMITEQNFTVVVNDGPPVIAALPAPSLTATVDVPYTYDMNATDGNLPITYALRGANPAGLAINATTGLVTWTPTQAQGGPQLVQLQATDLTGLTSQLNFTVVVNAAPVITSTPPLRAQVGVPYVYTIVAVDPQGPVEYDPHGQPGSGFPVGMTVGTLSGVVNWTPTLAQAGPQLVQLQAIDATGLIAEQNFTVVVNDGPPVITTVPAPPSSTAVAGVPYALDLNTTDRDTPIVYALRGANPAGLTINASTGLVTWTPTQAQMGTTQTVQLQATDAAGLTSQLNFTVNVLAPISFSPATLSYNLAPGVGTQSLTLTITNRTNAARAVTWREFNINNQEAPLPWLGPNEPNLTIPANGSATITLTATRGPRVPGTYTGTGRLRTTFGGVTYDQFVPVTMLLR